MSDSSYLFKVFLVYPPISKRERYSSDIGNSGGNQIPLGIFYLAAFLRQNGVAVTVVDAEANDFTAQQIVEMITSSSADLVAISSTTVAFHRALELATKIKASFPEKQIVLGGAHVTSNPHHAMAHDVFDFGVLGEGEETLLDLVRCLEGGYPFNALKSLVWRGNDGVVVNPRRPYVDDLDGLPFPTYDLIPDLDAYAPPPCNYKKLPVANIITSRGCPNQCTFCDTAIFGRRFRQRSAQNIADEIELLIDRYGIREIAFVDDTLTVNLNRVYELFEELDKRDISFPWTCMSRINTVDYDFLKFIRDHGCWHISFGIESGNPEILKIIKKNIDRERVHQVVQWCRELGIKTKGFFIVGHPGETIETINQTIKFALDLPLNDVVATINTPIPGSQQYAEVEQWGTLDETDWSQYNYWRPVFVPNGLNKELLVAKQQEFYRRFYLRPKVLCRYGLSFLSVSGPRRLWALLRSLPFLFKRPA